MHMGKLAVSAVAGIITMATPAAAVAPGVDVGGDQFAIGVVGFVPVICRANVDASLVSPGTETTSLGSLNEFCNSPGGYRVVANYSPSLASGTLVVDGQGIALTSAGSVVVSQSDHAAIDSHELQLDLPEGVSDGSLSFRIEPL